MKGIITLALAFQIWALTGAGAETISVPLPIIQGRYYVDLSIPAAYYNRQEHFEVGKIPLSVTGVSLHISGTFVVGETSCWLSDPADPDTFPQSLEFFAWLDTTGLHGTHGRRGVRHRERHLRVHRHSPRFPRSELGSSKDRLRTFGLSTTFMMFPECSVPIWPEATIEQAELIIEGEFEVAVEQSTWGSIKSLF